MEKKEYLKKSLTDMKRDKAKADKAKAEKQKKIKFKYKQEKGKLETGSKLATVIGNKASMIKTQSKRPELYKSKYSDRMKNTW